MERKKVKVLHMLTTDRYSGAENVVCQIAHMFRDLDQYEVFYCSPDGPIRDALAERDVAFVPIKAASLFEFRRVISEIRPDIVHAHDMRASFLASLVCGKIPLFSHVHNNSFDSRKITLKALLYMMAAVKARHIFWVSAAAQKGYCFNKLLEHKSSVLYNIIDPEVLVEKARKASCKDTYDVVFIGRMTYPKNPQRLVEVLAMASTAYPQMKAAVIGSGELENDVRNLLSEKCLQKNVEFMGFMSNPYGILQNSKLMIMTSRWEGMPMCALEAFALGVPIVATPTDGLRELVVNGKTGFLTDDNQELVQRIVEIVLNDSYHQELSQNALKKADAMLNIADYRSKLMKRYELAIDKQ